MPLSTETSESQSALARICRTGKYEFINGVSEEKANVYRNLIFNGVNDTLRRGYPITMTILGEERWEDLVQEFFSSHNPASPELWKMPKEFLDYLSEQKIGERLGLPYLEDLLQFEWTEIEVFMMADEAIPIHRKLGDLSKDRIVINPECRLLNPKYKVYRRTTSDGEFGSPVVSPVFVLLFRHAETKDVQFMELSPIFAGVVELLQSQPITVIELIDALEELVGSPLTTEVKSGIVEFLKSSHKEGLVLGFTEGY